MFLMGGKGLHSVLSPVWRGSIANGAARHASTCSSRPMVSLAPLPRLCTPKIRSQVIPTLTSQEKCSPSASYLARTHSSRRNGTMTSAPQTALIALGSNLGNRFANIEQALQKMQNRGLQVTNTSFLYETAPMYMEEQGAFYNGVCEVRANSMEL